MNKQKHKTSLWRRRKRRVREKILGNADKPRMSVFRSLRHIYVQLIDDSNGNTILAVDTMAKDFPEDIDKKNNIAAATKIGETVAKKAMAIGIRHACFDRNGYKYHGRIKAVADAARKEGLVI